MKLGSHTLLDAICAEYLIGTLKGHARRRFERALREEPLVGLRLRDIERTFTPLPSEAIAVTPSTDGWPRLMRELGLEVERVPWYRRFGLWPSLAAVSAVLALAVAITVLRPEAPRFTDIAQLAGDKAPATVTAALSSDRGLLQLRASQPSTAPSGSSYELWLLPADGSAPRSLGVVGALDARVTVPVTQVSELRRGAKLAVSIEPTGGSPTGAPTGPVILVGEVS
ncbi:MAG: anti-sigma factor [Proteobacteria bacterium]|nr:anti-sigma factor [Burkholderiales bacterium]